MSILKSEIKIEPKSEQQLVSHKFNGKSESFLETDFKSKLEPKHEANDPELKLWNEELKRIKEMVNVSDEKLITDHLNSIDDLKVIYTV